MNSLWGYERMRAENRAIALWYGYTCGKRARSKWMGEKYDDQSENCIHTHTRLNELQQYYWNKEYIGQKKSVETEGETSWESEPREKKNLQNPYTFWIVQCTSVINSNTHTKHHFYSFNARIYGYGALSLTLSLFFLLALCNAMIQYNCIHTLDICSYMARPHFHSTPLVIINIIFVILWCIETLFKAFCQTNLLSSIGSDRLLRNHKRQNTSTDWREKENPENWTAATMTTTTTTAEKKLAKEESIRAAHAIQHPYFILLQYISMDDIFAVVGK